MKAGIGYTPCMLLIGREMKLPIDLMSGSTTDGDEREPFLPEYVNDLKERLRRVHDFARNKLQVTSDRIKIRFDQDANPVSFEEGDAVWLKEKRLVSKITENLGRPYLVIKKVNDLVYRIQMSSKSKPKVGHIERLSPYHGRDPPCWNKVVRGEQLKKGE